MFRKATLAAVAAASMAVLPTDAEARHRDGYYDYGRYEQTYRGDRYYGRSQAYYGNRYYEGRRCSGTTGTIVGGVAGALLGREVGRSGGRGYYRRGGGGTTGAIIGGAIGALAGRAVAKSSCRNRY